MQIKFVWQFLMYISVNAAIEDESGGSQGRLALRMVVVGWWGPPRQGEREGGSVLDPG